ncbi:MAG: hypothetical protein IT320_04120 [Anaerolineae bacterium]|nr:hypothetical protein [Anaerolineae bacterium]
MSESKVEQAGAFFGLWTLNREASRYAQGEPPHDASYKLEPDGDAIKVTMDWLGPDGLPKHQVYTGVPDGVVYPYDGGDVVDAISMTLLDARTLDTDSRKDGRIIAYARRVLSEDGETMTITMRSFLPDGRELDNIAVYEKSVD